MLRFCGFIHKSKHRNLYWWERFRISVRLMRVKFATREQGTGTMIICNHEYITCYRLSGYLDCINHTIHAKGQRTACGMYLKQICSITLIRTIVTIRIQSRFLHFLTALENDSSLWRVAGNIEFKMCITQSSLSFCFARHAIC